MATVKAQPRRPRIRKVDPLVPPMSIYEAYVQRKIEGGVGDMKVIEFALANRYNVLVEGPTGCGKTMMFRAFAAKHRMRFGYVQCNIGIEPSQFFGRLTKKEDGSWGWTNGIVPDFLENGGVLLFNEINFLPDKISTALFSLLDERRNVTLLDKDNDVISADPAKPLLLAADCNPEYLGTRPLNQAFRNRFQIKSVWDYDAKVEKTLVLSTPLIDFAGKVRKADDIDSPLSTNMLQEFLGNYKILGKKFAIDVLVNSFAPEERPVVRQLYDTFKDNIDADLSNIDLYAEDDEVVDDIDLEDAAPFRFGEK